MIVTGANYRSTSSRLTSFATALLAMSQCISSAVDNLSASSPKTRQVIQRNSNNQADVRVIGSFTGSAMRLEARAVVMVGATNNGISTDWVVIVNAPTNGPYAGTLTNITAGGWYRIEVRAVDANNNVTLTAAVDRVGVGDIFVTAGQSNAACYGNPLQVPNDDRVRDELAVCQRPTTEHLGRHGHIRFSLADPGKPFGRIESGARWFRRPCVWGDID